jgi:nucleotide-binding universal stress UspA family protein
MSIKKILWASDGSEESLNALRWVEVLATRYGANVIALSVFETANLNPAARADDLRREIDLIDSEITKKETTRLTRIRNALERKAIKTETHVATGIPHQEIVKRAHDRAIDLIAMGKRGLTPWRKMFLGSTTTAVLREAHLPVLTVRHTTRSIAVKKILFPTVFSPAENAAFASALEFARKFGAMLVLLNIMEVHKSYNAVKGGFVGRLRDSASKRLHAMAEAVPIQKRKGVNLVEKVTAFPRAWSGIVNFVGDQNIDMIVMSTRARKGAARFFLGSIAEAVIEEAPCPVIAVPPLGHGVKSIIF